MTVTKINGFDAPYRSQTFQNQAEDIVQARGVLKMDGEIATIGGDVQIPPFVAIQNGLIIREDAQRTRPAPSQSAPYYLAVSALSPNAHTDDLVFTFPRSPEDISSEMVLLGYWDGIEWRKPQILGISYIYKDINRQNIDYGLVGPQSGLLTSVAGPNYVTTPGILVDRQGLRQALEETFTVPVLANDVDFNRVDRILYRRPNDDINRIGARRFILGEAHATTPTGVKETTFLTDTDVTGKNKVLFASTNAAVIISGRSYGDHKEIYLTRYNSDRTSQEVAPTSVVSSLDTLDFDAVIDETNDIHILYVNGGDLYYTKVDFAGTTLITPQVVHSSAFIASNVSAFYHRDSGNIFVGTQVLVAPSDHKIYLQVVNGSSGVLTIPVPSKQVDHMMGNLARPSVFVTDDYVVYIACEDLATGRVGFAKYNDSGDIVGTYTVVSDNTSRLGYGGTLVNAATQASIRISDNKEVFVIFRQEYAALLYGIAVWRDGSAFLQELTGVGENISDYWVCVDSYLNSVHLSVVTASDTQYVKLDGQTVQFTYQISASPADSVHFCKDLYGANLHVWSEPNPGTYSSYYSGTPAIIGDNPPINGGAGFVTVLEDEILVADTGYTPKNGDIVVISGNSAGNDGTYSVLAATLETFSAVDSHWRIQVDSVLTSEYPATGTADLQAPDGNEARFVKTNAELTADAFRLNVLDTDVLLARCSLPGPVVLNYGDAAVGPVATETARLLLYGDGTALDWEQTTAANLTISGPGLHISDMVNNVVFDIANGSYPMSEGQALFILTDPLTTAVTPQVTDIALLDWSQPIQVLGIIKEGNFAPHSLLTGIGFEELEPGESNIVGEGLPDLIRNRLGILSDTQYQPYLNHYAFLVDSDYATAISALDALVYGFQTDAGDIEIHEVTNPAGITSYTATKFTWDPDVARTDLQVYVNGKHLTQSLAGTTDYEFRKTSNDTIEFNFTVPFKAEVVLRKERTGGGSPGFLETKYEGTTLYTQTQKINFTGPGVAVSDAGAGEINVTISGGSGGSGVNFTKNFQNKSGGTLNAGEAVAFDNDGGLVLSDANISAIADFAGIVISSFANNAYGDVYKMGNCPGVLSGLGAVPGQAVYLGETPGTLTLTPPAGVGDTILLVGRAEPGSGVAPDGTAVDLYLNPQIIAGV